MDKVITQVYTTNDYSRFKKLKANRAVKNKDIIVKSINKVGYVLDPILVNENYEVIDGQNRLEALKELGLPVPYVIQEGIGIKECRSLNVGQSNWTTIQFVESYAEDGNESYIRLYDLICDFKKQLSLEGVLFVAIPHLIPRNGGVSYYEVKNGLVAMTEKEYENSRRNITSMIALGYADFKEKNNMVGRSYWSSVAYAYRHKDVDPAYLIKKMKDDPNAIVSCARTIDQLRYFDDAYNKGRRPQNKVFMASDIQKGLYL